MRLSTPTFPVFIISVVIAALTIIGQYAGVAIPVVGQYPFETLLVAYVILFFGNILRNF